MGDGVTQEPLDFEEFKDCIDNRKGYMYGVAKSYLDIREDCLRAEEENIVLRGKNLEEYASYFVEQGMRPDAAAVLAEMLLPEPKYLDKENMEELGEYPMDNRTEAGKRADERLRLVREWLKDPLTHPEGMDNKEYLHFIRYARQFFVDKEGRLYKRGVDSMHKLVIEVDKRMYILTASHDSLGHKVRDTSRLARSLSNVSGGLSSREM